jgi:phenylalanyl-tRNA synthetase beta chain
VTVFDVFEGGNLQPGQRSVAFRLLFQSPDATLEDQTINELRDKVVKAVESKFAVTLRG